MIENGSWRVRVGRKVSRFAIMMLIVLGVVSRSTVLAADERKHKGSDDRDHSAWDDQEHKGSGDWGHEGSGHKVPLATDWSHKHLVYSGPKTVPHAFKLSRETRYVQQWVRRNAEQHEKGTWRHQEDLLNGDWSMFLGNAGSVGADRFPAKFSFDPTTANCGTAPKPDFVVYNTSLIPSALATSASQTATFTGTATPLQTFQISNPNIGTTLTLTADASSNSGTLWAVSTSTTTEASNLASAINRASNGSSVGVSATASGSIVTVTSTNVGDADNVIALATTAPMTIGGIGLLAGGRNGASIVAFDNLYSGCGINVPSTFWAYNTGGTISTSISLSGDGSQVAFVQANNGTGLAELVLLKWLASTTATVNSPVTLTALATTAYRGCAAPCMTVIPFGTGATDSNSAPFYDFAPGSDKLYVGDDSGHLLQFTGVFAGTPAVSGAPTWPVNLNSPATATTATSPVFDQGAGKAYIADNTGFLYSVNVTTGAVIKSGLLGSSTLGFAGSPIVDASAGFVYLFASDNKGSCTTAGAVAAVYQIPAGFSAGGVGTNVTVGTCSDFVPVYDGQFDNAYYNSASGNAGNLYVCGNPAGNPTLYQIAITVGGALGAVNTGPNLATASVTCSPVTEVFNPGAAVGGKDWIFMSVTNSGNTAPQIGCPAAGCIMSFDVTAGTAISPTTATAARAAAAGGASGVVVDNTVGALTLAGASQVYFSTLANGTVACATSTFTGPGGCGTQASQGALN